MAPQTRARVPIAIGMYVSLPGKSHGRVVDRQPRRGKLHWIVKLTTGQVIACTEGQLTARVDS